MRIAVLYNKFENDFGGSRIAWKMQLSTFIMGSAWLDVYIAWLWNTWKMARKNKYTCKSPKDSDSDQEFSRLY